MLPAVNGVRRMPRFERANARSPPSVTGSTSASGDSAPVALEALAGFYEAQAGRGITIIVENGKLYGEPTGNPRRELVLQSGTTYTVVGTESPMTVTFVVGSHGRVTEMVMRQRGGERRFPKAR